MARGWREKIENYLDTLRECLRGVDNSQVHEFIEELRCHLLDKVGTETEPAPGAIEAALHALGSPEKLASQYINDVTLARAEVSRFPVKILESLFHWASLSIAGFFAFLLSLAGYFLAIASLLCALLKPFHPASTGLFVFHDATGDFNLSLHLGLGSEPAGGRDVLGWLTIPAGLAAGCATAIFTTRFARWCIRRYRRSRPLPGI